MPSKVNVTERRKAWGDSGCSDFRRHILFCGTTVSMAEARSLLGARWDIRAPIQRGDLPKICAESENSTVVIIDGRFHSDLSVSVEEIRCALLQGHAVIGTSSMGALRAADCSEIGMIGFGLVYRWLKLAQADDDEVCQLISPETFRPVSETMVDLRAAAKVLKRQGIIDTLTFSKLISEMKKLHFSQRFMREMLELIEDSGRRNSASTALSSFCGAKRTDALGLLTILGGAQ